MKHQQVHMSAKQEHFNRQIPAMMHSIDVDGCIVNVSQRWLDVMGYRQEEVLGRRSTEFMTEESCRHARENVLPEFFRTGRCSDIPYQMVTKQGTLIDVLLSATSIRDAQGNILYSLAVMQDVSILNATNLSLEQAKQRLETLLHTANVMVIELDQQGNLKRLNEHSEQITGYKIAELMGKNWFSTIVPRERYPHVWEEFERLLSIGKTDVFENPILTKEGKERYIAWRNSSLFEGGNVVGTLSVGIDITDQKSAERLLAFSEAALNDAQTLAQIGNWSFDYESKQLHWSAQIYELLEVSQETEPSKAPFLSVLHPEDYSSVKEAYKRGLRLQKPYELRYRLLFPNGNLKYVRQLTKIQFAVDGQPIRLVSTLQDITLQVLQELSIQESEVRFRTIADYTYDWEYWRGNTAEILYISPSCLRVTGYSQGEFIRDPNLIEKIIHPEDLPSFKSHLTEIIHSEENHLEFRIIKKSGEERWIAHGCRAVFNSRGEPNGRRVSNRDVTDLKIAEQVAQKLAFFDALTGLPNRRMLVDRLNQNLAQAKRFKRLMALMFIDLDRFKNINDTLGHDVGDELLIEVATRFSRCMRAGDTVARTGGDEFVVVLPQINQAADAVEVAGKLLESLHQPILVLGHSLNISSSIGIALFTEGSGDNAAELMKKADLAMYQAKRAGRNAYIIFQE